LSKKRLSLYLFCHHNKPVNCKEKIAVVDKNQVFIYYQISLFSALHVDFFAVVLNLLYFSPNKIFSY